MTTLRQRRAAKKRINAQLDALAAEAYARPGPPEAVECRLCGETYHNRPDCPECSEPA